MIIQKHKSTIYSEALDTDNVMIIPLIIDLLQGVAGKYNLYSQVGQVME